ncbi:lamin tail domain-containing protein [Candidatus Sumerlaeota bacterium]|nr:lamin tail domain-containing protein [Candidatus Sumerlaeota bacterium]
MTLMRGLLCAALSVILAVGQSSNADSVIVFNEIMYNPLAAGNDLEWVELYNQMAVNVDISNWRLEGGVEFQFPADTVVPGLGYLVIAKNPPALAVQTGYADALGPFDGNLSNGGESLRLLNNNDRVMNAVSYEDGGKWPAAADGTGFTLAKQLLNSNAANPANWVVSDELNGTPGAENFPSVEDSTIETILVEKIGVWRYNDSGVYPGAGWKNSSYDDSTWLEGSTGFYSRLTTVTLLSDNFNAATNSLDLNLDILTRQTGIFVPLDYDETDSTKPGAVFDDGTQINPISSPGQLLIAPDASSYPRLSVSPNYDFSGILRFTISFDVDAVLGDTIGDNWTGVIFSASQPLVNIESSDGVGILFRSNGGYQVWDNGSLIRSESAGSMPVGQISVFITAQDDVIQLFVNGTQRPIGASGMNHHRTNLNGGSITLQANSNSGQKQHAIDNLLITGSYTSSFIPNLFGTKLDATGNKLSAGDSDLDYTNDATGLSVIAMQPHSAWAAEDENSGWVGLSAQGTDSQPGGQYDFKTTFNLSGSSHNTAEINFRVAVDNELDDVLINGVSTGITLSGHAAFSGWQSIASGFLPTENELHFLFTNWSAGPMGLRIEMSGTAKRNSSVTPITPGNTTYYFRKEFTYNNNSFDAVELYLDHSVNDGAVFYLNGVEIHRTNMPSGIVADDTPASTDISISSFSGAILVSSAPLVSGVNVLAVELHDSNPSSDDMYFDMELRAERTPMEWPVPSIALNEIQSALDAPFFVELYNYGSADVDLDGYIVELIGDSTVDYIIPATTLSAGQIVSFDQTTLGFSAEDEDLIVFYLPGKARAIDARHVKNTLRGRYPDGTGEYLRLSVPTPGATNQAELSDAIVINEIMYHNRDSSGADWIEFFNRSSQTVDMTGWSLSGGIQFDFPISASIGPEEYLILTSDLSSMQVSYPALYIYGEYSGQLSDGGEEISLLDAVDNPVDRVHYHDRGRWPAAADGAGSSLELKDPDADNASPEAWAASDESGKASWKTYSYTMTAGTYSGVSVPTIWNEFIIGLLDAGEVLLDDISVIEDPNGSPVQLIQNGAFEGDAVQSSPDKWRLLGTHGSHGRSMVVVDPDDAGNHALLLVATDQTEHMHNHAETTLHDGSGYVTITNGAEYEISYRAKWLSGSNQVNTRLYFNRCQQTTLIDKPALSGTPGAQNSRSASNIGPAYSALIHSPALPEAGENVTVTVNAYDPDIVASVTLWWSENEGAFQSVLMSDNGTGQFSGVIPSVADAAVIQFYVEGSDSLGATTTFPAKGADSRAIIKVTPPLTSATSPNTIRVFMRPSDVNFLHEETNVMSNDLIGCTILYKDEEVFYDCGIKLRSSERGRLNSARVGYTIKFPDNDHLFRGVHQTIKIDRSGVQRGNAGYFGQVEMLNWHVLNRAGGIPSMYDDMIYIDAPQSTESSSALLNMAGYRDVYLDSQYAGGDNDGTLFKYELIYYPTSTEDGDVESLKLPQPDSVLSTYIRDHGANKEAYRWNFLISSKLKDDDYSRIIKLCETFSKSGADYNNSIDQIVDVDQWLRASAAMSLINPSDHYQSGAAHNLKLYVRPSDQRALYFPWDFDYLALGATTSIVANSDLSKMVGDASRKRLFYGHLLNIIDLAFNRDYLEPWGNHYQTFVLPPQTFSTMVSFAEQRAAYVTSQIESETPHVEFAITTNGGADFSVTTSDVTLEGTGWVDVRTIRLAGAEFPLNVEWDSINTWDVSIPLETGVNNIVLEAYDFNGDIISTNSIAVTTSYAGDVYKENLKVTELMYDPLDGSDYEYFELYNAGDETLDLSHLIIRGAIDDFAFADSAVTSLSAGECVLIVANQAAFESRYGTGLNIAGTFSGKLANDGESFSIVKTNGTTVMEFEYGDGRGWWLAADGPGHSLVAIEFDNQSSGSLSYGRNWRPSAYLNGSPGTADSEPLNDIRINEVSPHTDTGLPASADSNDWFEIVNQTGGAISLDDWYVSDDKENLLKYELSNGYSSIGAYDRLVFTENYHFNNPAGNGFGLNKAGEELFLSYYPDDVTSCCVVDVARFKGVENEGSPDFTTWGRIEDGAWWGLTNPSPDATNNALKEGIIINEIMYYPPTDQPTLEYIELVNPNAWTIHLFHAVEGPWRINGGVDYTLPPNLSLGPGENLLIVNFDPSSASALSNFQSTYGPIDGRIYGPFENDNLSNLGERIALERPQPEDDLGEGMSWVIVDEVIYFSLAPWTMDAAGTGNSLHRLDPAQSGNDWNNWIAAPPAPCVDVYDFFTVTLTSPDVSYGHSTGLTTVTMTATFSSEALNFTPDDIVVTNGSVDASSFYASESGGVFHFDILPLVDGIVTVLIPSSSAQRASDNTGNLASNTFLFYYIYGYKINADNYWLLY